MVKGKHIDDTTNKILSKMDADGSGDISLDEFRAMEKSAKTLLFPIFTLQHKLADQFLGEAYWIKAAEQRKRSLASSGHRDVVELHLHMYPPDGGSGKSEEPGHAGGGDDFLSFAPPVSASGISPKEHTTYVPH